MKYRDVGAVKQNLFHSIHTVTVPSWSEYSASPTMRMNTGYPWVRTLGSVLETLGVPSIHEGFGNLRLSAKVFLIFPISCLPSLCHFQRYWVHCISSKPVAPVVWRWGLHWNAQLFLASTISRTWRVHRQHEALGEECLHVSLGLTPLGQGS